MNGERDTPQASPAEGRPRDRGAECIACGQAFSHSPWRRDGLSFCSELCADYGLRRIEGIARSVR